MLRKRKFEEKSSLCAKDILLDNLGIPKTIAENLSYIEMLGNKQVIIDECQSIIDYNDEKIKLNLSRGTVCFIGSGLKIKALNFEQAVICGNIASIEFG